MGISFLTCHHCGETFPDCGDFVWCNTCEREWCCEECAAEDGYVDVHCTKYDMYGDGNLDDVRIEHECGKKYCEDCEFFVNSTCGFCRCEQYEDSELLTKALSLLHLTREELVKKMEDRD